MGGERFAQTIAYVVVGLFALGYVVSLRWPDRRIDPTLAKAFLLVIGAIVGNAFHVTFIKKPKDGSDDAG